MGETRVDLLRLLEDLRDAYPGSLEETILTEIVANALDSGARRLVFETDSTARTLVARDDGSGMTRRELSRYHDLAASSKRRGKGIGFAGIGIKLGLLACDEVITETRRGRQHTATSWKLANRTRAPWSWIEPPYLLEGDGTVVLLRLSNPLSTLLEPGFVEATVVRHFQPLFEPEFIDVLASSYPYGFTIVVNDRPVVGPIRPAERHTLGVRVGRQRKPARPVERDIRRVLGDLAGDYPLLATRSSGPPADSVGCRWVSRPRAAPPGCGAARRRSRPLLCRATALPPRRGPLRRPVPVAAAGDPPPDDAPRGDDSAAPRMPDEDESTKATHAGSDVAGVTGPHVRLPGRGRTKKPTTLSLQIRFETLPDSLALARLIESTVWVNDAHPAYRRALTSRAEGYHIAVSVAAALAPLAVEAHETQRFVSAFLARWGEAARE